jgi:undecaprenyl-diphosphatase
MAEANTTFSTPEDAASRPWLLLPVALVLAAAVALLVDVPIAQTMRDWRPSGALGALDMFETFGHGLGVIVLVLALHQLDRRHRWAIPRVLACALGAGIVADLVKLLVLRTRPYDCPLDGTVWSTFGQWLPGLYVGCSSGQSFPSAHTATAVGFAFALTWLYPQGRLLFPVLAILVGCQRIACGAHYPSDVLIGAVVGALTAHFLLKAGPLPRWFSAWEERWQTK